MRWLIIVMSCVLVAGSIVAMLPNAVDIDAATGPFSASVFDLDAADDPIDSQVLIATGRFDRILTVVPLPIIQRIFGRQSFTLGRSSVVMRRNDAKDSSSKTPFPLRC